MSDDILGIHHVTAITSDPQRNLDFYTGVLGLRLVKLSVNFDDPRSYHSVCQQRSRETRLKVEGEGDGFCKHCHSVVIATYIPVHDLLFGSRR